MVAIAEDATIWEIFLSRVSLHVSSQVYDTWFNSIECKHIDQTNKVIYLYANPITQDWVDNNYRNLFSSIAADLNIEDYQFEWIPDEPAQKNTEEPKKIEINESKSDIQPSKSLRSNDPINTLNKKYTFDNFVLGSCNQFAHAAAEALIENPGLTYNPLFIYGGVGLGKTHLMHAAGHAIKERNSHLRVAYVTSEHFMNETINAIRYKTTQEFRDKYRSIDVLLVDDVQFIAGKERTQVEFFHTFNYLHNNQKQIVMTSDCTPRDIPTLEERLHSRFEWGLIADIEPPDLETKVAILKRKADQSNIDIPDEIAFFIASKVKSNIRELEGTLIRLIAISSLRGLPISKMLAQDAMKTIIGADAAEGITIERVTKMVANHYDLALEEIKSKNNSRKIALPRQVAMYLCKRLTKHSFPEIGRAFGGKHHTTVMHSVEKIENLIKDDRDFHKTVSEFIDNLCS
ncbi:MAG: chromosomal replication initiator protein DnaA [Pyrinomonadaceae bacterium]